AAARRRSSTALAGARARRAPSRRRSTTGRGARRCRRRPPRRAASSASRAREPYGRRCSRATSPLPARARGFVRSRRPCRSARARRSRSRRRRARRRVELTPAGSALLERSRRALAEIDGAFADARRAAQPDGGILGIGYGRFSRSVVTRIAHELERESPGLSARLDEEVTQEALRRI